MKTQHIALLGGGLLVLVFVIATSLYNDQREVEMSEAASRPSSPLERDYAQSLGPADAKVVLVEFFDPACETCRVFYGHVKTLLDENPDKVRLVLRYAPFHHGADQMALMLEAARKQGKYWEALEVMYQTQPQWASHHRPQPEKVWAFLAAGGVNVDTLRRDMKNPDLMAIVNQDIADAKTLGVSKTPQFFVNGKPLMSFGYRQLKAMLDAEVAAQY